MGRSYFVEEAVGQYLSALNHKPRALITGLLIGQCSQQRDYVLLAIRTPLKEDGSENGATYHSNLSSIDEEWITEHVDHVSTMLPGGLFILGVFTIAVPEVAKEIQSTLRKLVFSVEKTIARKRLWKISDDDVSDRVALHLCSATKKLLCRTYDVQDPKSTAKPADWKYQSGLATSWASLECTTNVNIHIPLPTTLASHDLEKNTRNGVARWAKQIEGAVFLINGQVKDEDGDLLEGQKKSTRNLPSVTQTFDVQVLTQLVSKFSREMMKWNEKSLVQTSPSLVSPLAVTWPQIKYSGTSTYELNLDMDDGLELVSQSSNSRSTATIQVCSGSINLKGALKCKAYIHNNKPKVKDAVKALKRDIINTLSDRCEILFEDMRKAPQEKISEREYHTLPCRVFGPIAGSNVWLCDYKFGDETVNEIQERFLEMLDQAVQTEDLHTVEEMNAVEVIPPKEFQDEVQQKRLTKEVLLLKLHQNIGVVIAVAVAISAAAFSFNYFSD